MKNSKKVERRIPNDNYSSTDFAQRTFIEKSTDNRCDTILGCFEKELMNMNIIILIMTVESSITNDEY